MIPIIILHVLEGNTIILLPEGREVYGPMAKPEVRAILYPRAIKLSYCPQTHEVLFLLHVFFYHKILILHKIITFLRNYILFALLG